MIRVASFTVALSLALSPSTLESQASAATAPRDSVTAPRIKPTPVTLAIADTLLREMDLERVMQTSAMATFDGGIQANPALAPLRDVAKAWVTKHLAWAEVGPPMVQLYAETFTEAELRAFMTFYRTPAGRQLARMSPELAQRGAKIGAEIAAKHTGELEQALQAKIAEIQAAKPPQ